MSPRTSSRLSWALTQRRFRSGPRAAPQAAHTIGACVTSLLTTHRLTAPMPLRAGLFAGALGGPVLVRLAGFLGRSVGRLGGGAVRIGRNRFASLLTPIGVVTRRRTRTGRRILARAVSQQTRQLMQPPSQFLELLARHPREVGALDIVQLWGESGNYHLDVDRRM